MCVCVCVGGGGGGGGRLLYLVPEDEIKANMSTNSQHCCWECVIIAISEGALNC